LTGQIVYSVNKKKKSGCEGKRTYTFTSLDLTISSPENKKLLAEFTGQSKYNGFFCVYMFIHKNSGHKYVGSSNLLRRIMDYYLKGDFSLTGKFGPLLSQQGLKAFKLIIYRLDSPILRIQNALILEQYHLILFL
jgi:GIY-YIG catalytic domain